MKWIMMSVCFLVACTPAEQLAPLPEGNTSIERAYVFDQLPQESVILEEKTKEQTISNEEKNNEQDFAELLQSQEVQEKAETLQNPVTPPPQKGDPQPEVHAVRIFAGSGRELFPDQGGVYEIPSRIVNILVVSADNKGHPFQLRIRSPSVTFQQKSFSLNLRTYADKDIGSKYAEKNKVYYLDIKTPLTDGLYPYFFITEEFASTKKHHLFISAVDPDHHLLKSSEVDIIYRLV
ncbi:hypothetical protein J4410_07200 [Candidatus Woesearchaeota archaeon]|nr:hypothetical protein [Candidatus Woesearchaeota archaeon]